MAQKTKYVSISPPEAAQEGCSATCESYHQGVVPPSYQGGNTIAYTNYQVVATGAGNWRPIKIKISHFYTYSDGSTSTETITYRSSNYGNPNPWNFPSAKSYTEWKNPFEFTETDPGTVWQVRTVDDTITGVEVEFDESTTTYTITTAVSPAGGGTTTGGGTYTAGTTATLTATPNSGYMFLRWELNGVTVSTSAAFSVTVTGNATYTAVFRQFTNLLVNSSTYGTPVRIVYDDRSGGTGRLVADYKIASGRATML